MLPVCADGRARTYTVALGPMLLYNTSASVHRDGFEPPYPKELVYSQPHLSALPTMLGITYYFSYRSAYGAKSSK